MARINIPLNINTAKEQRPVVLGKYNLTIAVTEEAKTRAGDPQLKISIGIDGHDDAPNLMHFMSFPNEKDDKDKATFKALMMRRFLAAFNIAFEVDGDNTSFDTDDFAGAKANVTLTISDPDENGNTYNRLQLPKLKDEDVPGGRAAPRGAQKPPKR